MRCKKCNKEFEKSELMNGICFDCFEKQQEEQNDSNNSYSHPEKDYTENPLAKTFDIVSTIIIICGIIAAVYTYSSLEEILISVILIVASILSALFYKAISEIIQLLEDIKNK